MLENKI